MMLWPASAPASMGRRCRGCGRKRKAGSLGNVPSFHSRICFAPMRYDALVVGAGPAGCAAAGLLAQRGWSVALVEKAQFPRRKVCGEFISAATLSVLEACRVDASFLASSGPPVTQVGIYAGQTMLMS